MSRTRVPGPINATRLWLADYGDGSDASPASSTFTVAKQTYQWVNYTLDSGHTITLATAYKPSIFRCQGTLTINGAINGDGLGHAGGGAYGGKGAGPGGGGGGATGRGGAQGGGGGGGGHGANGTDGGANSFGYPVGLGGGAHGGSLDDLFDGTFNDHCAGSGGGGGGWDADGSGTPGAGGAGGAGLILIARRVVLGTTASITLDGANGGAGGNNNAGGGGGGSGGLLAIFADIAELPGSGTVITATAGSGGAASTSGTAGADGAVGRIYIAYLRSISPSDATSRSSPAAMVISLKAPVNIG